MALRELILEQKKVKDKLQNNTYVERSANKNSKFLLESDLIKVILGPRRAGKSIFASQLLKDKDYIYFNFEEDLLSLGNFSPEEIFEELKAVYGDTKYVLFDEIQNLQNWEIFANKLHRSEYNLILTGSNSKLLSGELATSLTGRHISIEILPFSFSEILESKKNNEVESVGVYRDFLVFEKYIKEGGYPEVVLKGAYETRYLETLIDSLIFKDIVKRFNIRFSEKISQLANYLFNNISAKYSANKLVKPLDIKSPKTVEKYIQYMSEAYMVFPLQKYSFQYKEVIKSQRKIYSIDNGFMTVKNQNTTENIGKLFENLVFVELLKRGEKVNKNIFYFTSKNNKEVDFIIKKDLSIKELIQVSWDIKDLGTRKREVSALVDASKELKCENLKIITHAHTETIVEDGIKIEVVNIFDWLKSNQS